jgi:hypothetical protein
MDVVRVQGWFFIRQKVNDGGFPIAGIRDASNTRIARWEVFECGFLGRRESTYLIHQQFVPHSTLKHAPTVSKGRRFEGRLRNVAQAKYGTPLHGHQLDERYTSDGVPPTGFTSEGCDRLKFGPDHTVGSIPANQTIPTSDPRATTAQRVYVLFLDLASSSAHAITSRTS